MPVPQWSPGTIYQPGAIVRPRSTDQVTQARPTNPSFETGLTGWSQSFSGGSGTWSTSAPGFDGPTSALFTANAGGSFSRNSVISILRNNLMAPVNPGQVINWSCRVATQTSPDSQSWQMGGCRIDWFDQYEVFISSSWPAYADNPAANRGSNDLLGTTGLLSGTSRGAWRQNIGRNAVAPPNAAFAQFVVVVSDNTFGSTRVDDCIWDYTFQGLPDGLLFRAVQALAGSSAATEPVWPTISGQQVVDNEVTWQAVFASRITWEATPILVSGLYEPDFPTEQGGTVLDGTIAWVAMPRRVTDENCPNSKLVAIAAQKVFSADGDIIPFSATVNPLDWTSENDAGYIPFGMQRFGDQPVSALGMYRTNLVAFSANGMQMWQVDPDPQNMAILDSVPVPCTYQFSLQNVANDLIFLTDVGIRSIGIAAASTNLQAGEFGKGIDPLVIEAISNLGTTATFGFAEDPIGLYWPGAGQYWLFFGAEAFVLTMNGNNMKDASWSRYVFPSPVEYWTLHNSDLYLRSGDLVWRVSPDSLTDDNNGCLTSFISGNFEGSTTGLDVSQGLGSIIASSLIDPTLEALFSANNNQVTLKLKGVTVTPAFNVYDTITVRNAAGSVVVSLVLANAVDGGTGFGNVRAWLFPGAGHVFNGTAGQTFTVETSPPTCAETPFQGLISWPYLDFGAPGADKTLEAFDLTIDGICDVQIGYNQKNLTQVTDAYSVNGDTLPDEPISYSVTGPSFQLRLTFAGGQRWKWEAATLYLGDTE